ncbi:hypothetical protein CCH79_00014127, partial [Gambusia affinis]
MSSDIYSKVQLSKKVRYTRNEQENRTDWEEKEVNIYESAENVADYYSVSQPQEEGKPTDTKTTSCEEKFFQSKTLQNPAMGYNVSCHHHPDHILMFSDIKSTPDLIQRVRYSKAKQEDTAEWEEKKVHIYNYINDMMDDSQLEGVTLEIIKLRKTHSDLSEMAANYSQLHKSYEILSKNHNQLTDQVKRLNDTITGEEENTWDNSKTNCEQRGAHLVIINSHSEQEFIKQFNKNGESWIGLQHTSVSINGQWTYDWRWVDESPLTQ